MKKLIAISVVFALLAAGTVFADTTISAALEMNLTPAASSTASGADVTTSFQLREAGLVVSTSNDDGSLRGLFKFRFADPGWQWNEGADGNPENAPRTNLTSYRVLERAFVWWAPIEQVKFFLGRDGDGIFNTAQLSRWGHHRGTRGVSTENWDAQAYLLGNWDTWSFATTIRPIDLFAIHFAWDLPLDVWGGFTDMTSSGTIVGDWFKMIQVQAEINLEDIGNIFITYRDKTAPQTNYNHRNSSVVGVTFNSYSLVDNLSFEVAANVYLNDDKVSNLNGKENFITAGIGAHYITADWGLRSRFFIEPEGRNNGEAFWLKTDIMPFYNFDFGSVFLNIRLILNPNATESLGWAINPYFLKNLDGGQFRAGIQIENESGGDTINWSIPLGILINF